MLDLQDWVVAYGKDERIAFGKLLRWRERNLTKCADFEEFLVLHPTLALLHPLGRRLASAVKRSSLKILHSDKWSRVVLMESAPEFNANRFLDPIAARPTRFSRKGQAALYLAGSEVTAALEVLKERGETLQQDAPAIPGWVGTVRLIRPISVLDLRTSSLDGHKGLPQDIIGVISAGMLGQKVQREDPDAQQYRATQYVADLARKRGIEGILYSSSRSHPFVDGPPGDCLVLLSANANRLLSLQATKAGKWSRIESPLSLEDYSLPDLAWVPLSLVEHPRADIDTR